MEHSLLKSCGCQIHFGEVSTALLYNVTMMFYRGVVTTSPNQDLTMMCYLVFVYAIMPFFVIILLDDIDVLVRPHFPCNQIQT